jgi:hypothetical protein
MVVCQAVPGSLPAEQMEELQVNWSLAHKLHRKGKRALLSLLLVLMRPYLLTVRPFLLTVPTSTGTLSGLQIWVRLEGQIKSDFLKKGPEKLVLYSVQIKCII